MDKLLHLGNTIAVFMISNNFLQKILKLIVRGIGVQPISLSHRIFWIENVRFRLRVKASKLEFHWIENNNGLQLLSILFHHHYVCLIKSVFSLLLITKKKNHLASFFFSSSLHRLLFLRRPFRLLLAFDQFLAGCALQLPAASQIAQMQSENEKQPKWLQQLSNNVLKM